MTQRMLTTGAPVPEDGSHTKLKSDGQQEGYIVLTPAERAKGFVKPVRHSYIHRICGSLTSMGDALSETYARNPYFYSGTFCCHCGKHFDLDQFNWEDGEPMEPTLQEAWNASRKVQFDAEKVIKALQEMPSPAVDRRGLLMPLDTGIASEVARRIESIESRLTEIEKRLP